MAESSSSSGMPPVRPQSITAIVAATKSNGIGKNGTLPWRLPGEMKYFARVTTGEPSPGPSSSRSPNTVIMGRKTWESIPTRFRPLKSRRNIVISRQDLSLSEEMTHATKSLEGAMAICRDQGGVDGAGLNGKVEGSGSDRVRRVFLIGGAQLYNAALDPCASAASSSSTTAANVHNSPTEQSVGGTIDRVLLTRITHPEFECDTFLSDFASLKTEQGERIWSQASHRQLCDWLGWEAPEGEVEEKGVKYRYEMWVKER